MSRELKRGLLLLVLATIALLSNRIAFAQDFPSRPISIIVPLPAGTVADLVARALADDLAPIFKQPVTVENRPSASQGAVNML